MRHVTSSVTSIFSPADPPTMQAKPRYTIRSLILLLTLAGILLGGLFALARAKAETEKLESLSDEPNRIARRIRSEPGDRAGIDGSSAYAFACLRIAARKLVVAITAFVTRDTLATRSQHADVDALHITGLQTGHKLLSKPTEVSNFSRRLRTQLSDFECSEKTV